MSKLKDALYDSLHSSSNNALHNALNKFLHETVKGGKDDIRSLKASSRELVSHVPVPPPSLMLLAGVAGLAAAIYFYCKHDAETKTKAKTSRTRPATRRRKT